MNRSRYLVTIFPSFALLAACAGDPAEPIRSANEEVARARVERPEGKSDAQQEREVIAERKSDHRIGAVDATKETNLDVVDAKANLGDAKVKMQREREAFDVDSRARFERAEARAGEARTKGMNLTGSRRREFQSALAGYNGARAGAQNQISAVRTASDDRWYAAKKQTEKSLDELERAIDKLSDKL
jgi:hypothetical protein